MSSLTGKKILVIGRGSGIARAVVTAVQGEDARVVVAGRDPQKLADAYGGGGGRSERRWL